MRNESINPCVNFYLLTAVNMEIVRICEYTPEKYNVMEIFNGGNYAHVRLIISLFTYISILSRKRRRSIGKDCVIKCRSTRLCPRKAFLNH